MKPGPAREGVPSRMLFSGKLARIASPTARGFFGAPGCKQDTNLSLDASSGMACNWS